MRDISLVGQGEMLKGSILFVFFPKENTHRGAAFNLDLTAPFFI